jgi:hypothetical protein
MYAATVPGTRMVKRRVWKKGFMPVSLFAFAVGSNAEFS